MADASGISRESTELYWKQPLEVPITFPWKEITIDASENIGDAGELAFTLRGCLLMLQLHAPATHHGVPIHIGAGFDPLRHAESNALVTEGYFQLDDAPSAGQQLTWVEGLSAGFNAVGFNELTAVSNMFRITHHDDHTSSPEQILWAMPRQVMPSAPQTIFKNWTRTETRTTKPREGYVYKVNFNLYEP